MKKLLFVASALAAISVLAPSTGFAQWENRIGIYTDPDPYAGGANARIDLAPNTPTFIYFVLDNPMHDGSPVANVEAFEFTVGTTPSDGTFFKLSESFNGQALNVSTPPEYAVGFSSPVPVSNNKLLLMTWQVMVLTGADYFLFITPISAPSIPGAIAYQDADGGAGNLLVEMTPSNGAFTNSVFSVNGENDPVAEETESWGSVKSLFR